MKVVKLADVVEFNPEKLKKVSLFDTDNFFCDIYCLESAQSQKVHSHGAVSYTHLTLPTKRIV